MHFVKDLSRLSGPWTGLSIQGRRRCHESLQLTIRPGRIHGTGTDVDGTFSVEGEFDGAGHVRLTRRYVVSNLHEEHVDVPFDYEGTWDGAMIFGLWCERDSPLNCGPFEMWPMREEDRRELAIELEELTLSR